MNNMFEKIKNYIAERKEYIKNKKVAKNELVKIASTTLPAIRAFSNKGSDIAYFLIRLSDETKKIKGDELTQMVLNEVANALKVDNDRIIEILSYMANLTPEEIQKILVHSIVETMPKDDEDK